MQRYIDSTSNQATELSACCKKRENQLTSPISPLPSQLIFHIRPRFRPCRFCMHVGHYVLRSYHDRAPGTMTVSSHTHSGYSWVYQLSHMPAKNGSRVGNFYSVRVRHRTGSLSLRTTAGPGDDHQFWPISARQST